MSSDISLSSAIRSTLTALQNVQSLINVTQNDLSTGLKVGNATDNPVAFFQAQALTDRATDFSLKKDGIDQGISSLSTSLEGVSGIESIVGQLQGLILSAESAPSSQLGGLVAQFNSLRTQINVLAGDSTYQGTNLIDGTGSILTVSFSDLTASALAVSSVDVTAGARGLAIVKIATNGLASNPAQSGFQISFLSKPGGNGISAGAISNNTFYFSGTGTQFKKGDIVSFSYGSITLTVSVGSSGAAHTFSNTQIFTDGEVLALQGVSAAAVTAGKVSIGAVKASAVKFKAITGLFVLNPATTAVTTVLQDDLQTNLQTLQTRAETIGSNVALLNSRLAFTNEYVNLLTQGAGNLTLADLNQEAATLLALQTSQQLGIETLSFAAENERSVLSLFR